MEFFYSLKSLDLVCMKKLDSKVNIIPVIAKADTISKPELMKFKVCDINFLWKNNWSHTFGTILGKDNV